VESKWKNYHIITFPGQSLSKTGLSLEEAMNLSRDRQIEEDADLTTIQLYCETRKLSIGHDSLEMQNDSA
jgi:hypothetical protein